MNPYFIILIIISFSSILGLGLYVLAYFLTFKSSDYEKLSAYECGFDPFTTVYQPFDVRYYPISIPFIVFDLEVSFPFPWSLTFLYIGNAGYFSSIIFPVILTFGFIYEWLNGAIEWDLSYGNTVFV